MVIFPKLIFLLLRYGGTHRERFDTDGKGRGKVCMFEWSSDVTLIIIMRQYRKVEWTVRLMDMFRVTNIKGPTAPEWREPDKRWEVDSSAEALLLKISY